MNMKITNMKKMNSKYEVKQIYISSALLKTQTLVSICKDCWIILCISVGFTKCTLGFFTVLASQWPKIKWTLTIKAQMKFILPFIPNEKKWAPIFGSYFFNWELLFGMIHACRSRPRKRQSVAWFTYESLYNSRDWWKEQEGMKKASPIEIWTFWA